MLHRIALVCLVLAIVASSLPARPRRQNEDRKGTRRRASREPATAAKAESGKAAERWHVPEARLRVPVVVGEEWTGPTDLFLADLKPIGAKGLTFDPKTKCANLGQTAGGKDPKANNASLGSAVFKVKPGYVWFTCAPVRGTVTVLADGAKIAEWRGGSYSYGRKVKVRIPPGTKRLQLATSCAVLREAGFILKPPTVARAVFCLPGMDPTRLTPVVYSARGRRVGCHVLWAHANEPMEVLVDSSSGEEAFLIYLVERGRDVPRLDWTPQAGLIDECRYPGKYSSSVTTLRGFKALWEKSDFVAGRILESEVLRNRLPFRPWQSDSRSYLSAKAAPLALSRYVGFFRIAAGGEYQFHFKALAAADLVVDGKSVLSLSAGEAIRLIKRGNRRRNPHQIVTVKLEPGPHRLEIYHYSWKGRFDISLGWKPPWEKSPVIMGRAYQPFEPVASCTTYPPQDRGGKLRASFAWDQNEAGKLVQCMAPAPAEDICVRRLTAQISAAPPGAVVAWRFDDGQVARGKSVQHVFLRPGLRTVTLDVLDKDGGKVLASVTGRIHVHVPWRWPANSPFSSVEGDLLKRAGEFATATPIADLVNLYIWTCYDLRHSLRRVVSRALFRRSAEVCKDATPEQLVRLGTAMKDSREQQYVAAERFLRAAMEKAPPGSAVRIEAALALADVLTGALARPADALALLEGTEKAAAKTAPAGPGAPDPMGKLSRQLRGAKAEAMLYLGRVEAARGVLEQLAGKSQDLSESERIRVEAALRSIRKWTEQPAGPDDPDHAMDAVRELIAAHPLLRLDHAVVEAGVSAHLARGEYIRAFLLASQAMQTGPSDLVRRRLLLDQVRAMAGLRRLDEARKIYKTLADQYPYSAETVQARQAIVEAATSRPSQSS